MDRLKRIDYNVQPSSKKPNTRFNRIYKRSNGATPQSQERTDHPEHQSFHVEYSSSGIFSAASMPFVFYPDKSFACDLDDLRGRIFKLRMFRNFEDKAKTRLRFEAAQCFVGYLILRYGADGSTNYERIGWASFVADLIDGTAFPEFLDGEKEEVITIV